jgi:hypothetical protein
MLFTCGAELLVNPVPALYLFIRVNEQYKQVLSGSGVGRKGKSEDTLFPKDSCL